MQSSDAAKSFEDRADTFCLKLKQSESGMVGAIIEEMEATPYSVESYLKEPICQPDAYSNAVKSPVIHILADDPTAKVEHLKKIILYYTKKRKMPELIASIMNAKNTKGQTFLDYFERLRDARINTLPEQQPAIQQMIQIACAYGGAYAYYPTKSCP
jgi:hypothetical protein